MFRNRNGYYMTPAFAAMFAPDDGGTAGADAVSSGETAMAETENAGDAADSQTNGGSDEQTNNNSAEALNAEIARLKADMAKQKAALDKATHEASESRKALKAKMTAEEIAAKEKEEADEKAAMELEALRREVAKGKTVKTIMGKLGLDEDSSGNLADYLYGASDIENALLEFQKAWQAKEAALRKEFGRVTGPGAGADSNSPEAQAVRRAAEFGKARNAQNEQAQKAMSAYMR